MRVGVVGLGLIGGSIGIALRDPQRFILGCDRNPEHERIALQRGCLDEVASIETVAQADIVFIATPPRATSEAIGKILEHKKPETVVTDCASIKTQVMLDLQARGVSDPLFVGGHPMAGHEKSGPAFSSAWMFRNARWILTPVKGTSAQAVRTVEKVVKIMGAIPIRMDPTMHDRHVAILSHVPHALAGALVLLADEIESWEAGAGSWRDLTRVGGVDPVLWTQIFYGNRIELAKALKDVEAKLATLRESLEQEDESGLRSFFERAKLSKSQHES